jgi:hypothetical protein
MPRVATLSDWPWSYQGWIVGTTMVHIIRNNHHSEALSLKLSTTHFQEQVDSNPHLLCPIVSTLNVRWALDIRELKAFNVKTGCRKDRKRGGDTAYRKTQDFFFLHFWVTRSFYGVSLQTANDNENHRLVRLCHFVTNGFIYPLRRFKLQCYPF